MPKFLVPSLLALALLPAPAAPAAAQDIDAARGKACLATMRVLAGALELYGMDHEVTADRVMEIETLVTEGYLRGPLACPEGGAYQLTLRADGTSRVACQVHGTPAEAAAGPAEPAPDPREKVRRGAETLKRACVANLKSLEGATELWLMEQPEKPERAPTIDALTSGGYLKERPACPAGGAYTLTLTPDGSPAVSCTTHGGLLAPGGDGL